MGLRTKFNLVFLLVFIFGFAGIGAVSYWTLQAQARNTVIEKASIILETAMGVRQYTTVEVRPLLDKQLSNDKFLPQSVPAYAATEVLHSLQSRYPDYFYKEATLNPTNLRDKAADWEMDIINQFRTSTDKSQMVGERDTTSGKSLFLARPITIKDPNCLTCHSVPSAAPKTMIKQYGENNGFGWKINETVGAQIVSVPMTLPINEAYATFYTFMTTLALVFLTVFVVANIMLSIIVIMPVSKLSKAADIMSVGDMSLPEFQARGKDEIALMAKSFNRMRRSLEKAMKMIDDAVDKK